MREKSLSVQRERFEDHYTPEPMSGCWLWLRKVDRDGYGRIWTGNKEVGAHRWSYESVFGALTPDIKVLHRCDIPSCVNPTHLFLGSQADNMQDCARKGRLEGCRGKRLPLETRNAIATSPLSRNATAQAFGVSPRTVQEIWKPTRERHSATKGIVTDPPPATIGGSPVAVSRESGLHVPLEHTRRSK